MKQSDGGLALSYNAQISADARHGLIVGVAVTQEANDSAQLLPAVDGVEGRLKKKPEQLVADGGYTTRDNIEKLAGREIDFLGSMRWENVPSGASLPGRLPPSAFLYQPEENRYVCPEGKVLHSQGRCKQRPGLVYYRYEAKAEDCQSCIRKPECCPDNEKRGRSVARPEESRWRFAGRWPAKKHKRSTVAVDESWNFATRGLRASWEVAAVSRARLGKGADGNAVGLSHLQLAALDPLEKTSDRRRKLRKPEEQIPTISQSNS
jgi:Transposase DDE domain